MSTTTNETKARNFSMKVIRFILILALPLSMFVVGFGWSSGVDAAPERSPSPLASIPGLARDHQGELRDDTLALYEAYRAEVAVSVCMRSKGHVYQPELAFPVEYAVAITQTLGISLSLIEREDGPIGAADRQSGRERNDDRVQAMSRSARNSYYQDLYGETVEDVKLVNATAELPSGRNDFATGGCVGKVNARRTSVYDLRSEVNETARAARARLHEEQQPGCSNPALAGITSFEQYEASYDSLLTDLGEEAMRTCEAELAEQASAISLTADEAAYAEHWRELDRHALRYTGQLERVKSDPSFHAFLAAEYPAAVEATLHSDAYLDE